MPRYPESYHAIVEVIGEEAARKLCEAYGGDTLYLPKPESLDAADKAEKIRAEYNGSNIKALADKYNLTRMRIYQLVEGIYPQIDGQISMDDLLQM